MELARWRLLLAGGVGLSLGSVACVVVLVEVLDEVFGDVEGIFSVEDVVADLGEDELVAAILVVLLELVTDGLHHILEEGLLLEGELLGEFGAEGLTFLLHADELLLLGLLGFSGDEGVDAHTAFEVSGSLLDSCALALQARLMCRSILLQRSLDFLSELVLRGDAIHVHEGDGEPCGLYFGGRGG